MLIDTFHMLTVELVLGQELRQRIVLKAENGNLPQHQSLDYHTPLPTVRKLG
jgi:hypothetical protein